MNLLSVLSTIIYTSFFIGAWRVLVAERKSILNLSTCAVLVSLGWWSFCNAFFFAAETVTQAWFWHKLSALGWCGFVAVTAYYFVLLTSGKTLKLWGNVLFFAPMVLLICKNMFGKTTSLAQNIVQSTSGWGWTYENSLTSFWLWAYLAYVALYFGGAFYLLHRWSKSVKHRLKREMASGFVVLDTLTILCGVLTDVVLPLTNQALPAMASIATALFGIGYFTIIYKRDLFNINLVISPDAILQTSNSALFVMDENREILKCNRAVEGLLGYNDRELRGTDFMHLAEGLDFSPLSEGGNLVNTETRLRCKNGAEKDVLLSASVAKDKHNCFLCSIVSCQDVSRQKKIQQELERERENYKKLADDYQHLAHFDPLTGLPNRRYFFQMLDQFEEQYRTEKRDFAVIFLDLDNFKHANDTYGHKGGDELLIAAAHKLQGCMEQGEFVARLGGDEFMVILPHADAAALACKLHAIGEEFQRQIAFRGAPYEIGISAGASVFSEIGDATKLMQLADAAMYGNKKKNLCALQSLVHEELPQ